MSDFLKRILESGTDGSRKLKICQLFQMKRKRSTFLRKSINKFGIANLSILTTPYIYPMKNQKIKKAREESISLLFSTCSVVLKWMKPDQEIKNSRCPVSTTVAFQSRKNKILTLLQSKSRFHLTNQVTRIHQWMRYWINWKIHQWNHLCSHRNGRVTF